MMYYIQDTRNYVGNCVLWWRVGGNGYTTNLAEAWKVNSEKAASIQRNRNSDVAWSCDFIDSGAQRTFDMQYLDGTHRLNEEY